MIVILEHETTFALGAGCFFKEQSAVGLLELAFEVGVGKKVTNKGKWNLTKTNETYIEFDFEDNSKRGDEQWRSKVNFDVWTLVGNAPKMNTGEMLKLNKRETRPE